VFAISQATWSKANLLQEVVCIPPEVDALCKENEAFIGFFVACAQQKGATGLNFSL
jgi:hypothetical protein